MREQMRVRIITNQNYQRNHVTGFWGGLTPDGQKLSIELFEDAPVIPEEVTMIADFENGIFHQESAASQYDIHRYIHSAITIPIDQLPSIIEWLKSKYEECLNHVKEQENNLN